MTAIQCVKSELHKLQKEAAQCVSEDGFVINSRRYHYQVLIRKIVEFKNCLTYLENNIENRPYAQ